MWHLPTLTDFVRDPDNMSQTTPLMPETEDIPLDPLSPHEIICDVFDLDAAAASAAGLAPAETASEEQECTPTSPAG